MDDRLERYMRRIRTAFPEFAHAAMRLDHSGQNNDVVVAAERAVFRFPRYRSGIDHLVAEAGLLRGIRPYLTLDTPVPTYSCFMPREIGQAFMGYPLLPGTPLAVETLASPHDQGTMRVIAAQLATFLKDLHRVPLTVVPPSVHPQHHLRRWEDMYTRIRQRLFRYMRADACAWTVNHFEAFLQDPANHAVAPVLVHGDFGASNILYHPERGAITGVIDFGSARPDNPAVDFAALSTLDPLFLDYCAAIYPEIRRAEARVAFYRGTFALQEALFGAENGDDAALSAGLEEYS